MATTGEQHQVFLSLRFSEPLELWRALDQLKDVVLHSSVRFEVAGTGIEGSFPTGSDSAERAATADVALFVLDGIYGLVGTGGTKSALHSEFLAARPGRVRAYEGSLASAPIDGRYNKLRQEMADSCELRKVDLHDVYATAMTILGDLRDELRQLDPEPVVPGRLPATPWYSWDRKRVGPLDRAVFEGWPDRHRPNPPESARLEHRSVDEWNEACGAFQAGLLDPAIEHLDRMLAMRPTDGEARYWLARTRLAATNGPPYPPEALADARLAAAVLQRDDMVRAAGLSHLLDAKVSRAVGDKAQALKASAQATHLSGGLTCEPHLERAVALAWNDLDDQAFDEMYVAFQVAPSCLPDAAKRFASVDRLDCLTDDIVPRIEVEARRKLEAMNRFVDDIDAAGEKMTAARVELAKSLHLVKAGLSNLRLAFPEIEQEIDDSLGQRPKPTEFRGSEKQEPAGDAERLFRTGAVQAGRNLVAVREISAELARLASVVRTCVELPEATGGSALLRLLAGWRFVVASVLAAMAVLVWRGSLAEASAFQAVSLTAVLTSLMLIEDGHRRGAWLAQAQAEAARNVWLAETRRFRELVHRFESVHLTWPSYIPPAELPRGGAGGEASDLMMRRVLVAEVAKGGADLDVLTPEMARVDQLVRSLEPKLASLQSDGDAVAEGFESVDGSEFVSFAGLEAIGHGWVLLGCSEGDRPSAPLPSRSLPYRSLI